MTQGKSAQVLFPFHVEETSVCALVDDDIKGWTAQRKRALALAVLGDQTTVAETRRAYNLPYGV